MEEASGINFKQNYNFNPTKINVENLTLKNDVSNKNNNNHIVNKDEEKNNNIQTPSDNSFTIMTKKRCLFCCLPIYWIIFLYNVFMTLFIVYLIIHTISFWSYIYIDLILKINK